MADINLVKRMLEKYEYQITSILIDEFGYSVCRVLTINEKTKDTDTVIVGYSTDYINNKVVADTHFITLSELKGADTVILGKDEEICRIL